MTSEIVSAPPKTQMPPPSKPAWLPENLQPEIEPLASPRKRIRNGAAAGPGRVAGETAIEQVDMTIQAPPSPLKIAPPK